MQVPAEQPATSCANCGAALVADQRYCLSCGKPASPVRLAFLDVLQSEGAGAAAPPPAWAVSPAIEMGPSGLLPIPPQPGLNGWLRRNSGLLGLLGVLLMCLFIGLLVGHWASQKGTPAQQVYKIEGLGALAAGGTAGTASAGTSTGATSTTSSTKSASKSSGSTAAKEAEEGEKETAAEKVVPKKVVAITPSKVKKLSTTHGKQHQKEINELGDEPIEVK
jgi:hypothetical protein